jgi:UDP-N-acetylglucosamine 2-epimerase (non-hydrolysing)/GDP/UDP-N,N'-diacetylbacillosamine 2-epimerase (hydrolysing)
LIDRTRVFISRRGHGKIFTNLDSVTYLSLLRQVDLLVGNSSSGIMESASFALPTVNVGLRQQGRERARNVLDADADAEAILEVVNKARTPEFRESLRGMVNPYGEGFASETIVRVLTTVPLSRELLMKRHSGTPVSVAVPDRSQHL